MGSSYVSLDPRQYVDLDPCHYDGLDPCQYVGLYPRQYALYQKVNVDLCERPPSQMQFGKNCCLVTTGRVPIADYLPWLSTLMQVVDWLPMVTGLTHFDRLFLVTGMVYVFDWLPLVTGLIHFLIDRLLLVTGMVNVLIGYYWLQAWCIIGCHWLQAWC